jgi:hypothetical protein
VEQFADAEKLYRFGNLARDLLRGCDDARATITADRRRLGRLR